MLIEQYIALFSCIGLIVAGVWTGIRMHSLWFGLAEIFVGLANIKFMIGWPK